MTFLHKFGTTVLLTALAVLSLAAPSRADGNPEVNLWLSSNQPKVGDPVVIYAEILGCSTMPTDITVSLLQWPNLEPTATLTKATSGFKSKIVRGDIQLQWIYRGPTGDGVINKITFVDLNASGGCVVDSQWFHAQGLWDPTDNVGVPGEVGSLVIRPIDGGLIVNWSSPFIISDVANFYEIQYAVADSNQWSRSLVTRNLSYQLSDLKNGVVYDIRVRATNRTGNGPWSVANLSALDRQYRTPASYSVWFQDSSQNRKSSFAVGDTVTVHMHLTNCNYQPSTQNEWGGSLAWTLFPKVNGQSDGWHTQNGTAESSTNSNISYDGTAKTYDVTFDLVGLSAGTYGIYSYFFGGGCSYPLDSDNGQGNQGASVEFTVGDYTPSVPFWGSSAAPFWSNVAIQTVTSRNSATLNWPAPLNVLDGPFTYAVYIYKGTGDATYLGTTDRNSYTITGLTANTRYQVEVRALNALQPNRATAPSESSWFTTRAIVVAKKSKTTAVSFAKLVGLVVPKGATLTMTRSKDKLALLDCSVTKNVLQAASAVGACTVDFVITPKMVGKVKPKPIKSSYDVMIRN